jgi:hypothetical protein
MIPLSITTGNPFASPISPFLLPLYRKPKRIRTAFSPGQLLKLEQAFEKNQYVVGQERKQLAQNLNLSETQVSIAISSSSDVRSDQNGSPFAYMTHV